METTQIDCRRCRHYHVTWDKRAPHGCRAMKFKSLNMPAMEVFAASGTPCQFFERKGATSADIEG